MIKIMNFISQMFDLRDSDLTLLILYRTQAIVAPSWPQQKVTERRVSDDKQRTDLFADLLQNSYSLQQWQAVGKLLMIWPKLESTDTK